MMRRRTILGALIVLISGCGFAQETCPARTPEQTLPPGWVEPANQVAPDSYASSYRLARIIVDPELHRRWALIANCTHPERPLQTIALVAEAVPSNSPVAAAAQHIVQTAAVHGHAKSLPPEILGSIPTMPRNTPTPDLSTRVPLIRAGDLVRLWSSNANVRLEMGVVSLEYGGVGQIVHLRRLGQTALLAGVVVGKDSAELIP